MHVDSLAVPTDTRAPTGTTNAVIVSGEERLLVDPAAATDALDAEVAEGIDHLAVTHTHPDHTGGVAAYADRATVWAKRGREARFREATGVTPDRTFAEGDRVGPARVLDTGGHAPDHVAFATPRGVVCGDLAVAEGSVAVAAPDGDVRAYLTALRRLHARDPSACYPGHGPTITDPRAVCARLIAHRLDREAKILAAVRDHGDRALDTAAVTDAAYEKDLTGVRDLAEATVRAHLEKLAAERRVVWDPSRDSVRTPR